MKAYKKEALEAASGKFNMALHLLAVADDMRQCLGQCQECQPERKKSCDSAVAARKAFTEALDAAVKLAVIENPVNHRIDRDL